MTGENFINRWFAFHESLNGSGEYRNFYKLIRSRVAKYPKPYHHLYLLCLFVVSYCFPLLHGIFPGSLNSLSDQKFSDFLVNLKESRINLVRMTFLFVTAPFYEFLIPEEKPEEDFNHPLLKLSEKFKTTSSEGVYDYVIIGSGAGGAPLAFDLVKAGYKVGLIERGGITRPEIASEAITKYYEHQGISFSINGGLLLILSGNTIGGTTSINSGTSMGPDEKIIQQWSEITNGAIDRESFGNYINVAKKHIKVCIPPANLLSESGHVIREGLDAIGRKGHFILPRNSETCQGRGRCCFVCPIGAKQSTDLNYIPEAVEMGLELFSGFEVDRIKDSEDKVCITCFGTNDKRNTIEITARKLILSAGALNTPYLIRSNQLGTHWKKAGDRLKIHPATKVMARFNNRMFEDSGIPQGVGYNPPEFPDVTLEGIHTPSAITASIMSIAGTDFIKWMGNHKHIASFGLMIKDHGFGSIRYLGKTPVVKYKIDGEDCKNIGAGIKIIAEAFFAAGAEEVLMPFTGKLKKTFNSIKDLNQNYPKTFTSKNFIISGFHPQGTAAINNVTDENLKIIGSNNVYVADASVIPNSPGVNPQITIMAFSHRLANHLIGLN